MISLTDLPEDLWNIIILPALSIKEIYEINMTSKAARDIVSKYNGHDRFEYTNIVTSIDRTYTQAEYLVKKFPLILLKLIVLSRVKSDRIDISTISDNISTLTCQYQAIYSPANIMPNLQKLNLRGSAPTINRLLEDCARLFPALTYLRLDRLIDVDKIEIKDVATLYELSIDFNDPTCSITIDNLSNLTILQLSTSDAYEYDIEHLSDTNMVIIKDVPNLSTLVVSYYKVNFDLTQLTSLKNITLNSVKYTPANHIGLYQINFNEAFPNLQTLRLSDIVTHSDNRANCTLGNIRGLKELYLTGLWGLKHIGNISTIKYIYIIECSQLETIKSITNVRDLVIINCPELDERFYRANIESDRTSFSRD